MTKTITNNTIKIFAININHCNRYRRDYKNTINDCRLVQMTFDGLKIISCTDDALYITGSSSDACKRLLDKS